jgi:hypothetical protein
MGANDLFQMLGLVLLGGCIVLIILERSFRPFSQLRRWLTEAARREKRQRPIHLEPDDFTFRD